jgi:hypothetical protein
MTLQLERTRDKSARLQPPALVRSSAAITAWRVRVMA